MELEFKPVVAGDIDRLRPFYGMRPNKTCDSVFLDSFLWKDYYHVQCAVSEGRAALWLMEKDGRVSTAMPLCREEDLPYFFQQMVDYFSEVLHKPFYISLADEEAVQYLNLDPALFEVEEQVDLKDYLYSGEELRKLEGRSSSRRETILTALSACMKAGMSTGVCAVPTGMRCGSLWSAGGSTGRKWAPWSCHWIMR